MEEKICTKCGRQLPADKFRLKSGAKDYKYYSGSCKDCEAQYSKEYKAKKNIEDNKLNTDIPITYIREFKEIDQARILDISKTDIIPIGTDEIFINIPDAVGYYISNYGRCIRKYPEGRLSLMQGNSSGRDYRYTVTINQFINGVCETTRKQIYVAQTVIQEFIVNMDMIHNKFIWHSNYDQDDFYYRNLYPVNEQQYYAIRRFYNQNGYDSDEVIANICSEFKYMPDDYRKKDFEPTVSGIGFHGCSDYDSESISYVRWKDMIYRCYSEKSHVHAPQYIGHSVCKEWWNYSNFRKWWDEHYYRVGNERMELDHNILVKGNLIYGPATAMIVPHALNTLITYNKSNNVGLPIGVYYDNCKKTYVAESNYMGQRKRLGYFKNADEASKAYNEYKIDLIKKMAIKYRDVVPYGIYKSLIEWTI